MDVLSPDQRRRTMAAVKSSNTKPEVAVRRLLHALGYRFRLHRKDLPGRPDIVLPRYKTVVFVHGCFWHQHPDCKHAARPTSNIEYWAAKLDRTVIRDKKQLVELEALGWQVVVVWECEIRDVELVTIRLKQALKTP
ncbi:DNA mismatch endonuclease (patch repair protein) [Oxalobacteraceae bacterium GrIS 1.11]